MSLLGNTTWSDALAEIRTTAGIHSVDYCGPGGLWTMGLLRDSMIFGRLLLRIPSLLWTYSERFGGACLEIPAVAKLCLLILTCSKGLRHALKCDAVKKLFTEGEMLLLELFLVCVECCETRDTSPPKNYLREKTNLVITQYVSEYAQNSLLQPLSKVEY